MQTIENPSFQIFNTVWVQKFGKTNSICKSNFFFTITVKKIYVVHREIDKVVMSVGSSCYSNDKTWMHSDAHDAKALLFLLFVYLFKHYSPNLRYHEVQIQAGILVLYKNIKTILLIVWRFLYNTNIYIFLSLSLFFIFYKTYFIS